MARTLLLGFAVRPTSLLASCALACLLPCRALALSQPDHQALTQQRCQAAGLPGGFCSSLARAAYNVDAESWTDLSAHGQTPAGMTSCAAADATLTRLQTLADACHQRLLAAPGNSTRDALFGDVATDLGRALHTLQDTCVHAGMTNPQHAILTDSDLCKSTQVSPDVSPEGKACAERITDQTLGVFLTAFDATGLARDTLGVANLATWTHYPALGDVCDYMQSALTWDGIDRRWNNDAVLPVLSVGFESAQVKADCM
jgi:hypothetical protein